MRPKHDDLAYAPDIIHIQELVDGDWVRNFRSARDLINRQLGRIERLRYRCRRTADGFMGDLDQADLCANTGVLIQAIRAAEEQLNGGEAIATALFEDLNEGRQPQNS